MSVPVRLFDTLRREVVPIDTIESGKFRMYNCGPTVYSDPHIGNFRAFLLADLLRRTFERRGYEVTQVMNITDVGHLTTDDVADAQGEDKLEKKAREEGLDPYEIARGYEKVFFDNLDALGCVRAHEYPRATEHIPEMIEMIERLVGNGYAYEVPGVGVYFRVNKFPEYGKLSGNTQDELQEGARIAVDDRKESPNDFALWKIDDKHLMQWESPWGKGFPGWHIECSAMSRKYLTDTFDLHTGGEDNVFPHHECERAQSLCATDGEFARYWVHTRFLLVDGTKMSKSLGNFYTVNDLLEKGYSGLELRYSLIGPHYRQPMNFVIDGLEGNRQALRRLHTFRDRMHEIAGGASGSGDREAVRDEVRAELDQRTEQFESSLDDDLNVSGALATVHETMRFFNREEELSAAEAAAVVEWLASVDQVLGLELAATATSDLSAEEQKLLDARVEARANRDFAASDRLRDELLALGIEVTDTPDGQKWRRA